MANVSPVASVWTSATILAPACDSRRTSPGRSRDRNARCSAGGWIVGKSMPEHRDSDRAQALRCRCHRQGSAHTEAQRSAASPSFQGARHTSVPYSVHRGHSAPDVQSSSFTCRHQRDQGAVDSATAAAAAGCPLFHASSPCLRNARNAAGSFSLISVYVDSTRPSGETSA